MKNILVLLTLLLSFCLFSCKSLDESITLENKRVVILGDSITNAGLYVSYLEHYLQKSNPKNSYDIISIGLSSETVSGLSEKEHPFPRPCVHERLDNILKVTKPEVLFTCYGMNDGIYTPQGPKRFQAFKDGYDLLIKKARKAGVKQLVILTPPPFDPLPISHKTVDQGNFSYRSPYFRYNNVLTDYSKYLMTINKGDIKVVDLHTSLFFYTFFKRKENKNFTLSRDGIHPGKEGHLLMAQTILRSLEIPFEYIEPFEYSKLEKKPLFELIAKKRSLRSRGWLDYIGYTRGKTVKKDSVKDVEEKVNSLQYEIDKIRNRGL